FCQYRQDDPNRPLPDHKDTLALRDMKRLDPLQAGIDRFDVASLLERYVVGDLDQTALDDPIHHPDVFGETAARGLVADRHAYLLVGRTLGEDLAHTIETFAARNVMEHHYTVAGLETCHASPDRGYDARGFMPEDARR